MLEPDPVREKFFNSVKPSDDFVVDFDSSFLVDFDYYFECPKFSYFYKQFLKHFKMPPREYFGNRQ